MKYRGVEIWRNGDLFCYTHRTGGVTYSRWSLSSIQKVIRHFVAPAPGSSSAKCVARAKAKQKAIQNSSVCDNAGRPQGRTNDCTVRTLSAVTGLGYELSEYLAEMAGREMNKGFNSHKLIEMARKEGFRFEFVLEEPCQLLTFAKTHKKGRYYIYTSGHAIAIIDGKIQDMGFNSAFVRVKGAWKFIPYSDNGLAS